jgi:hypothetical protein
MQFCMVWQPDTVLMEGDFAVQGRLPSEHESPDAWRVHCPKDQWYFDVPSEAQRMLVKRKLSGPFLTKAVLEPDTISHDSTEYRTCVPWKLRHKLVKNGDSSCVGWGFAAFFRIHYMAFCCIWILVLLLVYLFLVLVLCVPPNGPFHGSSGDCLTLLLVLLAFLTLFANLVYLSAKQTEYRV